MAAAERGAGAGKDEAGAVGGGMLGRVQGRRPRRTLCVCHFLVLLAQLSPPT